MTPDTCPQDTKAAAYQCGSILKTQITTRDPGHCSEIYFKSLQFENGAELILEAASNISQESLYTIAVIH